VAFVQRLSCFSAFHFGLCHYCGGFIKIDAFLCRGLQELVLKYCQKIGDEGLVEVGKGCSQLQALHLVDCSSIGDVAIRNIALGCHQLRRLHIRRCYKVHVFVFPVSSCQWHFQPKVHFDILTPLGHLQ
jgi:hypothetical protein